MDSHLPQLPHYRLENHLAEGGMASVYLGKQLSLNRDVAIKILSPELLRQPEVREAFESEAFIISRLVHPHIVQVIDRGSDETGKPYFVMEYVRGVSLSKAITLNTLSLPQRYKLAIQICQAIAYAHGNHVIHRDIKPDNILVDMQGNAKVLDFGIAVLEQGRGFTATPAVIAGTLRYMAPELMQGQERASVASDIFSLGFVLYELFTGVLPHNQGTQVYQPLSERDSRLSQSLDQMVQRCLASSPAQRPHSVQEMIHVLREASRGLHLAPEQRQRAHQVVGKRAFVLLEVLAEEEQHASYLFEEPQTHRQLVVKKLSDQMGGFLHHKRLMGLRHPHILPVLGVTRNERVFIIVTPYTPGGSLKDRLLRPFSLESFLPLARALCSAMAFAHQNGIYHLQLKPDHVLFDEAGQVQIADFGLVPKGGDSDREGRSEDLGAAGLIFYRMLTASEAEIRQGRLKPVRGFKQLPESLQNLLLALLGLSYQPFNSFMELQVALDSAADKLPTLLFRQQAISAKEGAFTIIINKIRGYFRRLS